MRYGIIFWGGDSHGLKAFKMQKRVVRLMGNVQKRMSCRELFKKLRILPMPRLYIMEMIIYIKMNNGGLKQNLSIHQHETRQRLISKHDFVGLMFIKKV